MFTKYVNLHLGRAYDVMTGKEYCELAEVEGTIDENTGKITYVKPRFSNVPVSSVYPDEMTQRHLLDLMVESGFKALLDAFAVVQNEHLFNVFNSNIKVVEEFNETNARYYFW